MKRKRNGHLCQTRSVGKAKVLGVTLKQRQGDKGILWWNEEVQGSIDEKKQAKENWDR